MKPGDELLEVVGAFCENVDETKVRPLGFGNINDTYLVESSEGLFVLQKINRDVFPKPESIIQNFATVTAHLSEKNLSEFSIKTALPVQTTKNSLLHRSISDDWWRAQTYVEHISFRELQTIDQARELGSVLASFHNLLADLEPEKLAESLPGFHDLRSYWAEFLQISKTEIDPKKDNNTCYCLEIIEKYNQHAMGLHKAFEKKLVTRQLVHGDPKLENFMFNEGGSCLGILDLDTVALGFVHHDIGDCLRSCCNVAGEMGGQPVSFRLEVCSEFLKGYFGRAEDFLKSPQINYIYDGILHICFELGLRFFMDYLRGNVYFKVREERENLHRAVSQFQLVEDVAAHKNKIHQLIKVIKNGSF